MSIEQMSENNPHVHEAVKKATELMTGERVMDPCSICTKPIQRGRMFDVINACRHVLCTSCNISHILASTNVASKPSALRCPFCRTSYAAGIVRACCPRNSHWTLARLFFRVQFIDRRAHMNQRIPPLSLRSPAEPVPSATTVLTPAQRRHRLAVIKRKLQSLYQLYTTLRARNDRAFGEYQTTSFLMADCANDIAALTNEHWEEKQRLDN
jgi:hypothetical protein